LLTARLKDNPKPIEMMEAAFKSKIWLSMGDPQEEIFRKYVLMITVKMTKTFNQVFIFKSNFDITLGSYFSNIIHIVTKIGM
jgi:hypothetical protein